MLGKSHPFTTGITRGIKPRGKTQDRHREKSALEIILKTTDNYRGEEIALGKDYDFPLGAATQNL